MRILPAILPARRLWMAPSQLENIIRDQVRLQGVHLLHSKPDQVSAGMQSSLAVLRCTDHMLLLVPTSFFAGVTFLVQHE